MADRAHRIEVDRCGACTFYELNAVWNTLIVDLCHHPARDTARPIPVGSDDPPNWCPLRGAVTMIAGPAKAFER